MVGLTPGGSQTHKRRWREMSALDIAMLNLLELRLKQEKSTLSLLTSHYWRACCSCSSLPWGAVGSRGEAAGKHDSFSSPADSHKDELYFALGA